MAIPDSEEVGAFLERAGGVAVLANIDIENGSIFREINDAVHISQTTLSDRLDEAVDLKLLERTLLADDHANSKRYVYSEVGEFYREEMVRIGLFEAYERFDEARRQIEDGIEEMKGYSDRMDDVEENVLKYSAMDDRFE